MKMKIELPFTIGDSIGMLQKVIHPDGTTQWRLIESPIKQIDIRKNGISVKTKTRFYTLDADDIISNTEIMETAQGFVLTGEVFMLSKELRKKAEKWVKWANENPEKAVGLISGQ